MSRTNWRYDESEDDYHAKRDGWTMEVWHLWRDEIKAPVYCYQIAGPRSEVFDGERMTIREAKLAATRAVQEAHFQEVNRVR